MKWNSLKAQALAASTLLMSGMAMAGPDLGAAEQQATNWHAIIMFVIFVAFTLVITKWAAKQTTSTTDFYTAGGGISGFQNGLAIAGDYMSAASFLGISALVFSSGFDGLLYSLGFMVGWPIVLFLVAERLRNLGKFNLSDVVSFRLEEKTSTYFGCDQFIGCGCVLPHRSDGWCRTADQTAVWFELQHRSCDCWLADDGLRDFRRYAGNHLGTDHQSGDVTFRCNLHGIYGHERRGL